jgi:hypothetical protein
MEELNTIKKRVQYNIDIFYGMAKILRLKTTKIIFDLKNRKIYNRILSK